MIQMEDNAQIRMLLKTWKTKIQLSKQSILYIIIMGVFSLHVPSIILTAENFKQLIQ